MWLFQLKTHTVLPQFLFDWHWSHTYISHRLSCALLCFFINSSSPVWIKTTELRVLPCALAPRTQVVSSRTQQDTHTCPTCSVRPAVVMVRSGTVELPVRFPRLHAGNMLLRGHTLPGRVLFAVGPVRQTAPHWWWGWVTGGERRDFVREHQACIR